MRHTLHITNGDCAAELIRQVEAAPGMVLAWKDILYEGPVPGGLTPEKLNRVRAVHLSAAGYAPQEQVFEDLQARDAMLDGPGRYDEIVLWFEHDLCDQLQLIQVLDRLNGRALPPLSLVTLDRYPGIVPFLGLGQLRPDQLEALWLARFPVTQKHIDEGKHAWAAFTAPTPEPLNRFVHDAHDVLPFLRQALRRHSMEFPVERSGLSWTQHHILSGIARGTASPFHLFLSLPACEGEHTMGMTDLSFLRILQELAHGLVPLITGMPESAPDALFGEDAALSLTPEGLQVLEGALDHVALNGIDAWRGGLHLHDETVYRWRAEAGIVA